MYYIQSGIMGYETLISVLAAKGIKLESSNVSFYSDGIPLHIYEGDEKCLNEVNNDHRFKLTEYRYSTGKVEVSINIY